MKCGERDGADTAAPPRWKVRSEPNPDIPLDTSSVPAVQDLIRENNAENKLKKRMRLTDFLNHAFCELGVAAVEDRVRVADVFSLLRELTQRHHNLPRNTSLSKILYLWGNRGMTEEGVALLRQLLVSQEVVPDAFAASFDERVATVSLRLLVAQPHVDRAELSRLLALLPAAAFKRRVFSPVLQYAQQTSSIDFAFDVFRQARRRGIELWDADYHELLLTIERCRAQGSIQEADVASYTNEVLYVMSEHQPVVGAGNAAIIKALLGGAEGCISAESGECHNCGCTLQNFDLSDADRRTLTEDILERLVKPRVEGFSRYEPEKKVTPEEQAKRWQEFDAFKTNLSRMAYDTVIDGANVGYYGLNSWYQEAKEELLQSCGIVPSTVPLASRVHPPFPVDVPPKFALVEEIRKAGLRLGRQPIVVLHHRHLQHVTPANLKVLKAWREAGILLASPHFLNDDYCWLYAAIVRPHTFIMSNDQMRDHHFCILSPRFFIRWRQRHRITYKALFHQATRSVTLSLSPPRPYSVWVQRAALTAAASAPVAEQQVHWHIPVISNVAVIDQATNRTEATERDVDLNKNGDDDCSTWLCTFSKSDAK